MRKCFAYQDLDTLRAARTIQEAVPDVAVVGTGSSWLQQFLANAAEANMREHGALGRRKVCVAVISYCTEEQRDGAVRHGMRPTSLPLRGHLRGLACDFLGRVVTPSRDALWSRRFWSAADRERTTETRACPRPWWGFTSRVAHRRARNKIERRRPFHSLRSIR